METVEGSTEEELVSEVLRVLNAPLDTTGFMRTEEIREKLGEMGILVGKEKTRNAIKHLIKLGKAERGYTKFIDMAGRNVSVPAYRLKGE